MIYRVGKAVLYPVSRVLWRPTITGTANVPLSGGVVIASNHLSFIDSFAIPLAAPRKVRFLAKDDYFTGTGLGGTIRRGFFEGIGAVLQRDNEYTAIREIVPGGPASLSGKIAHFGRLRPQAAFLLTDEAWALSERRAIDQPISRAFYFTVALTLFGFWQVASVLGTLLGAHLEHPEALGLDFAFPAFFIALALGFWKGARRTGPVLVASATVAVIVHATVPGAWYVIAGALAGIVAAVLAAPREVPAGKEATP